MRNSWLKLCKYINYSWFPSRKHTQVLRFFQSHDHMIYRRPPVADLVWKSALLHKCEILEDLHQRLVPEKGDRWEITCQYMWSHGTMWHSTIPIAVRAWIDTHSFTFTFTFMLLSKATYNAFKLQFYIWSAHSRSMSLFLAPYSPFLNPIEEWSLEMEGFWPLSTGQGHMSLSDAACQDTAELYQEG